MLAPSVIRTAVLVAAFLLGTSVAFAQKTHETNSPTATALRAIVSDRFELRSTEHFIIAYDCSYDMLRPHVGLLEGTYDAVLRFAGACDLAPHATPTPTTLPIIFFDRFPDFADYARTMGMNANQVSGFYHSGNNIAAFVNTAAAPNLRRISDEIARANKTLRDISREGEPGSPERAESLRRNIELWRIQRDRIAQQHNRFVLQHEAAHQVLFNAGVHARTSNNPQWLIEGLACQFEVPQTQPYGKLVGINQVRLGDLRDALGVPPTSVIPQSPPQYNTDKLMLLSTLVSRDDIFTRTTIDRTTLYAQSWALVFYLHQKFPDAFARYLRDISQRPPHRIHNAEGDLDGFAAAFCEPNQSFLEDFLAWILKLRFDPQAAGR